MVKKVNSVGNIKEIDESDSASLKFDRELEKEIAAVRSSKKRTAKEQETNVLGDSWAMPFYLRYRLATVLGAILSVGWLWLSLNFINNQISFSDLGALLPHEVGGMAAGTLTPLARGKRLPRRETS